MTGLREAVDRVLAAASGRPLGIILAGHNGSGKSTMWREHLAQHLRVPLVNADRMMLSILPEPDGDGALPGWASHLRDHDASWMQIAQKGVEAFVAQAMLHRVPFAMETVFSHWIDHGDGRVESKIRLIEQMQEAGYFVLLLFVGLTSPQLSLGRVLTRVALGGHAVDREKLFERFPRTQRAIGVATSVADASILVDNSLDDEHAFTVWRVQLRSTEVFDRRRRRGPHPAAVREWLNVVSPIAPGGPPG